MPTTICTWCPIAANRHSSLFTVLSPTKFRDLVSGRQKGLSATLFRAVLHAAEVPYTWAVSYRNRSFDRESAEIHDVDVPVISVGNLTLGGTGKTPLVQWIARYLRSQDTRVSIISRGYGAEQGEHNDEALELELALPDVPHLQNPNRVEAAEAAIEELETELILLDDGFQHRRLARDLDIVLLDATEPFGYEHVFPRGTLREPLTGLARAHIVILSRADMLDAEACAKIHRRVSKLAPDATWCEVTHKPHALLDANGQEHPLAVSPEKQIAAFSAIGNPTGFRHTLKSLGYNITTWREFPDHHTFTQADVESLISWAAETDQVLCTRKDLVKLGITALGNVPLYAVDIQLNFLTGQSDLEAALDAVCCTI